MNHLMAVNIFLKKGKGKGKGMRRMVFSILMDSVI
jgi:hypothetical protein